MWKRTVNSLLLMLLAAGFSVSASAASFNCKKAMSFSEKLICAEPEASTLDEDIALLYRIFTISEYPTDVLKSEQIHWLKARNACTEQTCVYKALRERRSVLMRGADAFASFEKRQHGVIYHVLIGTQGGKLEWANFASINERANDCGFSIKRLAGKLVANEDSDVKFTLADIPGGFSIRINPDSGERACGLYASLPTALRVVNGNVFVDE